MQPRKDSVKTVIPRKSRPLPTSPQGYVTMDMDLPPSADPIVNLLTSYSQLNIPFVQELSEAPSALEFMRYVARNRPFVVRGGASQWEATRTWNVSTLKHLLGNQLVNVAVTPDGYADSVTPGEDGTFLFVKPWEEQQPFDKFLDFVTHQELNGRIGDEVRYGQTQNDNLRNEYATLFSHVEKDISWARIALQQSAEAINLWIGNSHSVTALHKDNFENVYCQVIGQKHFLLLPPLAHACVAECELPPASYVRHDGLLKAEKEHGGKKVPFATWDPNMPLRNATKYSHLARPVEVTLNPGDMLYLPALWYHKVSQSCSAEGICCAVNYWYDMEFSGSLYPLCDLARAVSMVASNN